MSKKKKKNCPMVLGQKSSILHTSHLHTKNAFNECLNKQESPMNLFTLEKRNLKEKKIHWATQVSHALHVDMSMWRKIWFIIGNLQGKSVTIHDCIVYMHSYLSFYYFCFTRITKSIKEAHWILANPWNNGLIPFR